jgi:hypothetical protein
MRIAVLLLLPLLAGGCLAKTALDVATMPVKAVGWTADKMTTSQSEADEKRGRELRKQDERLAKEERRRKKEEERRWKEVQRQRAAMQREGWDY